MDLPLHVISQTASTITLGWTPPAGASGYRFTSSASAKVSVTWDPSRNSVKFSKADWYKVEALQVGAAGVYPSVAPPPPPPPPPPPISTTFGAKLHDGFEWVLQESPGPVVSVSTVSELLAALSRSGAIIDGGGRAFQLSDQLTLPAVSALTTLQNARLTGGRIYKANSSKWRLRNLDISLGSPEDNVKADSDGAFLDIDSCNIHNAPRQGILLYPHSDFCLRNSRVHHNGSTTNQDHGIYTGGGSRLLIYNTAFYENQAYNGQFYPHYHGGLIVCCTFYGGKTRGGAVIGSENSDPTSDLRFIGCISAKAPWWGFEQYQTATNITLEDCLGWSNGSGDFDSGLTVVRGKHGDPMFVDPANGNFRLGAGSAAKGIIDPSLFDYVPPRDIDGSPRVTADAGAFASQ